MDVHDEAHGDDMGGAEDQDDLSSGLAMAVSHHIRLLQLAWRVRGCQRWRQRHSGSVRGRAPNKKRDFNLALRNILRGYWGVDGEPPVFDEADFECRFRMPRAVFMRVYNDIKDEPLFRLWHHSQADPTRAAFPTGHPVVSSKTPEVSAKTHTHNWCGR